MLDPSGLHLAATGNFFSRKLRWKNATNQKRKTGSIWTHPNPAIQPSNSLDSLGSVPSRSSERDRRRGGTRRSSSMAAGRGSGGLTQQPKLCPAQKLRVEFSATSDVQFLFLNDKNWCLFSQTAFWRETLSHVFLLLVRKQQLGAKGREIR